MSRNKEMLFEPEVAIGEVIFSRPRIINLEIISNSSALELILDCCHNPPFDRKRITMT